MPEGIKAIAEDSQGIWLTPPAEVEAFLHWPETFLRDAKNNDQAGGDLSYLRPKPSSPDFF
jgi:hypothetical protein